MSCFAEVSAKNPKFKTLYDSVIAVPQRTVSVASGLRGDLRQLHDQAYPRLTAGMRGRALDIRTGRPVTLATNGMVTSPHSLGSAAGLDVLRAGGSAIDAAIAASAVLAVVYPHMTGLGGDAFWLIHDGASGEIRTLNGGGKAAEGATLSALEARGLNEIPLRGIVPATLTVPGAVASWTEAHTVHGRLPLGRVLESAIGLRARRLSGHRPACGLHRDDARRSPEGSRSRRAVFFARHGRTAGAKLPTQIWPARCNRSRITGGRILWRCGRRRDGAFSPEENGGLFRLGDFGRQKAVWGEPLVGHYRDVTLFNTPPPTQGFTVLEMLNLLEPTSCIARTSSGPTMCI
jgi:gamma-glutamyltranspeptidase/glutathione hydrolase